MSLFTEKISDKDRFSIRFFYLYLRDTLENFAYRNTDFLYPMSLLRRKCPAKFSVKQPRLSHDYIFDYLMQINFKRRVSEVIYLIEE